MTKKIRKFILFAFRILYIQYQALVDIFEFIWITLSKYKDQDYLEMEMRNLAHVLEKSMQNPEKEQNSKNSGITNFRKLQALISTWDKNFDDESLDIKWVKKIYKEFSLYLETGQSCVLVGKVETKLRGLREIHKCDRPNTQAAEIDLLEFMKGRRSVRNWSNEPITREQINSLIKAANWAPSSCNRQTNRFIIIQNRQKIKKISTTVKGGHSFIFNAPLLIVAVNDIRRYQFPDERHAPFQDSAAAIQNILLMAHRIGLGCCWCSYTSGLALAFKERKIRQLLNIPRYFKISGIVAIGNPAARVCIISRRDINKTMFIDKME